MAATLLAPGEPAARNPCETMVEDLLGALEGTVVLALCPAAYARRRRGGRA